MRAVLVIDAGTTAFKAVVFDQQMQMAGVATAEFDILHPGANRSELDADAYWQSCLDAVRTVIESARIDSRDIDAIVVTSHTDTLFVLDDKGRPLAPVILWTDPRADKQASRIQEQFGLHAIYHTTGLTGASSVHFASRLAWFLENNKEMPGRVRYFLQTQDFLIYRFTGRPVLDNTIAGSSLLGCLAKNSYWDQMLDFIGVGPDRLSTIVDPGTISGEITSEIAASLGLRADIPVIAGAMDAVAAAVGLNNISPGTISEITGAVLVIGATCDEPKFDGLCRVPCSSHAIAGKYLLMPWCETAGNALKWYRDCFFSHIVPEGGSVYDAITAEAAGIAPGCDGVMLLPHFAGSGSPDFNSRASAVVYGLTLSHGRGHISRAFLESIAFMLERNLEVLADMGIRKESIVSGGGGSRSALWSQIKADVTGLPVIVPEVKEATSRGAALLAARTMGWHVNADFDKTGARVFAPDPESHRKYQDVYQRFCKLNRVLSENFWTS